MDNISGDESTSENIDLGTRLDTIRGWAHEYIRGGWAVFMLSTDGYRKLPPKDCPACYRQPKVTHDPEACACLTCHGFYAATTDRDRFDRILAKISHGHLAIRTGQRSRILVVDAESHSTEDEQSGLQTLDEWESWVRDSNNDAWSLPTTLEARSVNGGIHKFYRIPAGCGYIKSGRVLPGVDIKADGGYVGAVSGIGNRTWTDPSVKIATAPPAMIDWLHGGKRRGPGSGGGSSGPSYKSPGYDFKKFVAEGCPDGHRNNFINELLFRERKNGTDLHRMLMIAQVHWSKMAQLSKGNARWEMPWHEVVDMAERVFAEVEPETIDDVEIPETLRAMARHAQAQLKRGEVVVSRRAMTQHPGYGKR